MKIEFIIILITGFIVMNIYHDGKYFKMIKEWKKYYQMGLYGFLGLSLFIFIRKYPLQGKELCSHAHNFIKFMPMDKESGDFLTPIFKMSSNNFNHNISPQFKRMMNSGVGNSNTVKRSVSETNKKIYSSSTKLEMWKMWLSITCMV